MSLSNSIEGTSSIEEDELKLELKELDGQIGGEIKEKKRKKKRKTEQSGEQTEQKIKRRNSKSGEGKERRKKSRETKDKSVKENVEIKSEMNEQNEMEDKEKEEKEEKDEKKVKEDKKNEKNEEKKEEISLYEVEKEEEKDIEIKKASAEDVFSSGWIADPEKRREIQLQILHSLLSTCKDEKINDYNEKGETLLMRAAALRSVEIVSELLSRGADPNIQNRISKEAAIHFAVGEGNIEITKLLIDNGADVSLIDLMGFNCLHVACFCSGLKGKEAEEMFQMLVENGIPIDAADSTRKAFAPIHFLCAIAHAGEYNDAGDEEHVLGLVKMICEKLNADPCIKNSSNMLPVHLSAERGHPLVCEFLLNRISLNSISENDFIDVINSQDDAGNSPLHLAILKKKDSVIEIFRNYPFNWDLPNNDSETPNQLYETYLNSKHQKNANAACNIL